MGEASRTGGGSGEHSMVADSNPVLALASVDREAHEWMMRFTRGDAGPAELTAFEQWSADPTRLRAFARACRLWEAIEPAHELMARLVAR